MENKPNESLFIPAGHDLQKGDERIETYVTVPKDQLCQRWKSKKGQHILQEWKESHFSREKLESLVGKFYGQIDLRGIPLTEEDLEKATLHNIDFFAADLRGANLSKANLEGSQLSEANLEGTDFSFATMRDVFLDNVQFDKNTKFIGVNLNAINFNLAALLQELALEQQRIVQGD